MADADRFAAFATLFENDIDMNAHVNTMAKDCILHYVDGEDYTLLSWLLDRGADPNVQNVYGNTPLMQNYNYPKFVDIMISAGANVNHQARDGRTALHYVAPLGYPKVIEQLINHGADVNIKDECGDTPADRCRACLQLRQPQYARDNLQACLTLLSGGGSATKAACPRQESRP